MRRTFFSVALVAALSVLATGCAKTSDKLGRGCANVTEFVRMGELGRSIEQTSITQGQLAGSTTGAIVGFNKSLLRTCLGAVEIVTAPFPPYEPMLTHLISAEPAQPDARFPMLTSGWPFTTDRELGFSGGYIAPMLPGNQFFIFSN